MFGMVPNSTGRMYSAPGGSGTCARLRSMVCRIMRSSCASSGTGSISSFALWRRRAMCRSMRKTWMLPSA